jgi:alpha-tubulin suppressor-like RCC1 family protein
MNNKLACTLISLFLLVLANSSSQTVSFGGGHSLFLCYDGSVMSTGQNVRGQLGDNSSALQSNVPSKIPGLSNIVRISAGDEHSLFVDKDGIPYSCGYNYYGQLGLGTNLDQKNIKQVPLGGIVAVSGGAMHSLFLQSDGSVWTCGSNEAGQLGTGSNTSAIATPVKIPALNDIIAVSAGRYHSLFLRSDGAVFSSGSNSEGQCGLGTTVTQTDSPALIATLPPVRALSTSQDHSIFLLKDSTVWVSGKNNFGQLGSGDLTNRYQPLKVPGLSHIAGVAAGGVFSIFLDAYGNTLVTGNNNLGELGTASTQSFQVPTNNGLTGIVSVFAGGQCIFLYKSTGEVIGFGHNTGGALGTGDYIQSLAARTPQNLCALAASIESQLTKDDISFGISSNNLFIQSSETLIETVHVSDVLGKLILDLDISNRNADLTIEGLSPGIYVVDIHTSDMGRIVKKFIKND